MATSPQPRDPLEVTPERLTSCADVLIEYLTSDTARSFHWLGQYTISERDAAHAFLTRLNALPKPHANRKGGLDA